ncbi:P-loop containing nucleoside triphosphate hydrolase [Fusarium austroafricanum]|uniref:P-loop containing nucleoside triphosphate hydrolase n=1 Tax=Fusarium austroafricanum TaxID=2364996 RepID=A0A8H4JSF3_9HYPO|nr:P-loop containing nucleoside triphosphate hydrolase [Fusarium austroafricanum]
MLRKAFRKLHRPKKTNQASSQEETTEVVPFQRPTDIASAELLPNTVPTSSSLQSEGLGTERKIQRGPNLEVTILYEPPTGLAPIVDIVFVHGLRGNSFGTWYSGQKGEVHWPSDLLKVDIPDARILSFGYDAAVLNWWSPASQNRIGNHAKNLMGSVVRLREKTNTEDLRLIFVMHSLGGLVVQNALDLSRSSPELHLNRLESNTVGLIFMGTPHFGSNKARWGGYCTAMVGLVSKPNKNIVKVLERDSEMLATIQNKFHEVLRLRQAKDRPISITCFYEELASPVVGTIVEMNSAILPGYSSYGIHADHMGMTKFTGSLDKGYEAVSGEMMRWVKDTRATVTQIVELQEECLRCLYFDGLDSREESIGPPLEGTFAWIWDRDRCKFVDWLKGGSGLYWITGRALSGKSTLLKYITTMPPADLRKKALTKDPIVASYFLGGKAQHPIGSTLEGIARALLWQILRKDHRYFGSILVYFQDMKRCRPTMNWQRSVLWEILLQVLSQKHPHALWIFLDGLDKFPGDLFELADVCKKLAGVASKRVRICISSRPEKEFMCSFDATLSLQEAILKLEDHTQGDITMFATKEISRLSKFLDSSSRKKLVKSLSVRANGLFMWVKLASRDVVETCMSGVGDDADKLLGCLDNLPDEITELYREILKKQEKHRELASIMLGVVEFGKRSFTLREFAFILNPGEDYPNERKIDSVRRKCDSIAGGLLDHRNGRVLFAHETVSSFIRTLLNDPTYSTDLIKGCLALGRACVMLLESVHLAQYWDHHSSDRRSNDPVVTTLAFLLLCAIPPNIFTSKTIEVGDLEIERLQVPLRNFVEWKKLNLNFLVSVEFSPDYRVFFNAGDVLRREQGRVTCKVSFPKTAFGQEHMEFEKRSDWIRPFLERSDSVSSFDKPVRFIQRASSGLDCVAGSKKEVIIKQSLFEQIQIVLFHCIQAQPEFSKPTGMKHWKPSHTFSEEGIGFPTPLHYAAFNGLDKVIEVLHEYGADLKYISRDSSLGTPLMAAIWGLSEKRYATPGIAAIETLEKSPP